MNKLKVLQVNKLYYPETGGIERVIQQIAEGLKEETQMKVLVCDRNKKTVVEQVNGVTVTRAGSLFMYGNMPLSLSFFTQFRKLSKESDLIHIHMPFPLADMACLLTGYKGKVVVWWHSDVVRQKKMMTVYKPIMLRLLKRADAIIVATKGHIDGSEYLKPFQKKCVTIPFGVEPTIEQKADQWLAQRVRETTQKEDMKVRFLFVGRLVYYKGCNVLIDAFAKVKGGQLIMVGSGAMEEEIKEHAKQMGLHDSIQFLGNISDEELEQEFASCDVFVLPSIVKSEAFGLVQIEAMAYEKPVINTNLPSGVPYVSIHMQTGLTVEPEDVEGLTEAMQWMIDHPTQRREMGVAARKRVKAEYQMNKMLASVNELYQHLSDRN